MCAIFVPVAKICRRAGRGPAPVAKMAPAVGAGELLPQVRDVGEEFRSKQYWDGFFTKVRKAPASGRLPLTRAPAQRGARAFEWYSEWAQLRSLVRAAVGADEGSPTQLGGRLLVVGCGNSELSAQLYDDGFQDITNIDFSKARTARSTQHYADLAWLSTRHV